MSITIALSPVIVSRSKPNLKPRGFTLIELVVVITLISVMMVFAVPRLSTNLLSSDSREVSKWIVLTVKSLKEQSVRQAVAFTLHVDLDNHKFWTSRDVPQLEAVDAFADIEELEDLAENKEDELELPGGFRVVDVVFPGKEPRRSGVVPIRFYKKGYSDQAMIHLEDDRAGRVTYEIEPFLLQVQIHEEYVEF